MALDFLNNPSSALPGPKPARYYTDGDFDLFRQALLALHGLFARIAQIEGALGVNQQFRDQVTESLNALEQRVDRLAAKEPHSETLGAGETSADATHSATGTSDGLAEVINLTEARTSRAAAAEAKAETLTVGEVGTDTKSDPFVVFVASLPRPLQAGKYPVANASGSYDYKTADEVLQALLAPSSPGDDVAWISTAGV